MGSCASTPHPIAHHLDLSMRSNNNSTVVAQSLGPPQERGEQANGDVAVGVSREEVRPRVALTKEDSSDLMISLLPNGPMTVGDAFAESAECGGAVTDNAAKRAKINKHSSEQQPDSSSSASHGQLNASVHSEQSGSRDVSDPALVGRSTSSWSTSTVQHQSKSIKGLQSSELDVDLEEI